MWFCWNSLGKLLIFCHNSCWMAENEDGPWHCPTLESLAIANAADLHQICDAGDVEVVSKNIENEPGSTLFNYLLERNQLFTATGFTEAEILSLHQLLQPFTVSVWQPGAHPKSNWLDMIMCYLTWFKLGKYIKTKLTTLVDRSSTGPARNSAHLHIPPWNRN